MDFKKVKDIFFRKEALLAIFVVAVVITNFQSILSGPNRIENGELKYCSYNNYIIFTKSFGHLVDGKDLYVSYPDEYWDLFKYSPSFAAFFGFFAAFPDWMGLFLWNLLNALVLYFAIVSIPRITDQQKIIILGLIFIEFFTSIQNEQSNALMAGLIIFAFSSLESRKYLLASFLIVFSIYIKLFGLVAFALYLFYPKKLRLTLYTLLWFVVLFFVPLIFVDWPQYLSLFESYGTMLAGDASVSNAFSVMGWLHTWFGLNPNKILTIITGALMFLLPLIKFDNYKQYVFRLLTLASILIWVVIFNHKAESPTYIIAMAGVSIWFVVSEKSKINIALLVFVIVFSNLSPTDLFPAQIREGFVYAYSFKVFPMILVWLRVIVDGFTYSRKVLG